MGALNVKSTAKLGRFYLKMRCFSCGSELFSYLCTCYNLASISFIVLQWEYTDFRRLVRMKKCKFPLNRLYVIRREMSNKGAGVALSSWASMPGIHQKMLNSF